jgi:hypothetical protein
MVIKGEKFVEVNAQQLVRSFVQGRVVVVIMFNSKDTIGIIRGVITGVMLTDFLKKTKKCCMDQTHVYICQPGEPPSEPSRSILNAMAFAV